MTEQARVKIVCPECGGPLPAEAANVAVTCERCGHASAPLPHAGAAASVAVQLPCPRCRAALFEGNAHGTKLLGCGICGGIFLDNEASTRITKAKDAVIARVAERVRDRAVAPMDTRAENLPCPSCRAPMRHVYTRGYVEVDFCSAHGTWFDRGEVNRVMEAYAPRPDPDAVDAASRAAAEARMAAFREQQMESIQRAESTSAVGAFGVTVGILGVLGALVGASDT